MNMENKWKPAIIGGILLGVLSSLPLLNCGCCAWIIGGGFLAAYLYVKESPLVVTLGQGAILGLLAGVIGTVVMTLFTIPMMLLSPEGTAGIAEQIQQVMDQIPGFPEESRKSMAELASQEDFLQIVLITSIFAQLVFNCLFAMLGGALGVAIFEKRKTGDASPQTPEIPAPPPEE